MIKYSILLFFASLLFSCNSSKINPPNIILINADDLSAYSLGIYGNDVIQTPRLDQMAVEGTRFTEGYSPASTCGPSRISLLLGQHTGHIPYRMNGGDCVMPKNLVCFPELLQKSGYKTAMFGKNGGIKQRRLPDGLPSSNGFNFFVGTLRLMAAHQFYVDGITAPQNRYPKHLWKDSLGTVSPYYISPTRYTHNEYVDLALNYIQESKNDPFFLYLPFQIPHYELAVPEEGDEDYREEDHGLLEQYLDQEGNSIFGENAYVKSKTFQRPNVKPVATYAAMISRLDRDVGKILDLLEELALKENTIVIFTSDNGGVGVGGGSALKINGNTRGGKGGLYEGGLKVPYIFWGGSTPSNKTIDKPIVGYDMAPTILSYANVINDSKTDGIDWKNPIENSVLPNREYLYWENYHGKTRQALLLDDRYKFVRTVNAQKKLDLALYDLENDPNESINLVSEAQHNSIIARAEEIFKKEHVPNTQHNLNL